MNTINSSDYFQHIHADPNKWLDLYTELALAREELPKSAFQPRVLWRSHETMEARRTLQEDFTACAKETAIAAHARFVEGEWPERLSPEAIYFLKNMLSFALHTVATIAPNPDCPLKPTIFAFPDAPISEVALWFMTEWWIETGGQLYETQMVIRTKRG